VTYYNEANGAGACSYLSTLFDQSKLLVAAAANFNVNGVNAYPCGSCVEINVGTKRVVVKIVDQCPNCGVSNSFLFLLLVRFISSFFLVSEKNCSLTLPSFSFLGQDFRPFSLCLLSTHFFGYWSNRGLLANCKLRQHCKDGILVEGRFFRLVVATPGLESQGSSSQDGSQGMFLFPFLFPFPHLNSYLLPTCVSPLPQVQVGSTLSRRIITFGTELVLV
jgi:hypothetical protein